MNNTLVKSVLLSSVSSGGKIKAPRQPNIWCGDVSNGYIPGDLIDANGLADFIIENDLLHDDPAFQALHDDVNAVRQYVDEKIQALIDGSPESLNTFAEIANALGNDPEFLTKIMDKITESQGSGSMSAEVDGDELIIN